MGFQPFLERRHTPGWLQRAFLHIVQRNQVYVSRHSPQLFCNEVRLPVMVIDSVDHGVLKGNPPPCFFKIPMAGVKQLLHIVGPVHRHDLRPGLAVRRMERYRQRQLQIQLRQPVNARNHAAGRKRDVAHPDIQTVRVIHKLQKTQYVIQIVHRFADAHKYDVADWKSCVLLRENDLIQYL